jgi:hypothetical protein
MRWRFAGQLITCTSFRNVMGPRIFRACASPDREHDSGLGSAPKLAAQCLDAHERFTNTGSSDAPIKFKAQKFCATNFHFRLMQK